jgi:hypothetical protein
LVDRRNRDDGAALLRDLIDGRITNDEFLGKFPKSTDPALQAIYYFAWGQFSDLRVHKLTGHDGPPPERLAFLERCYLFLKTDLEFEWPVPKPSIGKGLLELVGLQRWFRASEEKYKSRGEFDVWPFLRRSDYETQTRALCQG